jgi:hypothetical protein
MTSSTSSTSRTSPAARTTNMGSAWGIAITVVIVNSMVQTLLILNDPTPPLTWWIWPQALISFGAIVAVITLVLMALQLGSVGECSWSATLVKARSRFLPLSAYTAGLAIATVIGFALWVVPGLIILAASPYLLIAVADGRPDPLRNNVRAIRAGLGRWILLLLVTCLLAGIPWLGSALAAFFWPGAIGTLLTWMAFGLAGTALLQLWCRNWRNIMGAAASPASSIAV